MDKQTISKIELEISRFQSVISDAKKRLKFEAAGGRYDNNWNKENPDKVRIDATKESSALRSSYKVMKYEIDKVFRP